MRILQESLLKELLELENLLDVQLPSHKAAPTKEILSCLKSWSHIVNNLSQEAQPLVLEEQFIKEGLELAEHPVFICGVHRSGTTLMRDLLDNHPQLSVLPSEGSFYTQLNSHVHHLPEQERSNYILEEWLRRLVNPINQPPYWLLGRSSRENLPYVQFARSFNSWIQILQKQKSIHPANLHTAIILAYSTFKSQSSDIRKIKYWVDKTPVIERYYNEIKESFPNSKFIHVVRNPFDIFHSRKSMEPSLNMNRFIDDLKYSFKTAMKHFETSADHYLIIKYEDLLFNTKGSINRILRFLDIEETTSLYQPTVAGLPAYTNSSFAVYGEPGTIIKNNNKPEINLSERELDLLSAHVSRFSSFFGYKSKPLNPLRKLSLKASHAIHRIS